jgi:transposase
MGRKIDPEIKAEAIRLVEEHGVKAVQVAKELGIGNTTLEKWLKAYRTTNSNSLTVDEKAELKKLRAENRTLKIEKDLLKKATVYFAKNSE